MKEFLRMMRRFVSPYKKYALTAVALNVLSAVFNVFSFTLLVPILNILFKTGDSTKVYEYMEWGSASLQEVAVNNFYYYVSQLILTFGSSTALLQRTKRPIIFSSARNALMIRSPPNVSSS
jgi:ATP-binding cassette, subfamily B, bacterial MsbA